MQVGQGVGKNGFGSAQSVLPAQSDEDGTEYLLPVFMQQVLLTVRCFIQEFGSFPSLQSALPVR